MPSVVLYVLTCALSLTLFVLSFSTNEQDRFARTRSSAPSS